ncbi:acireductone synthase [Cyanobium sp. CH-040]|nr:acireductone synthase [Cyanobium sp. CH-040]
MVSGIRQVLLDIEGTTCPVSFVAGTLFPYASRAMGEFLAREAPAREEVRRLLEAVHEAWRQDPDPEAKALLERNPLDSAAYLRWLIEQDRKLPPLKELQGLVWRAGYDSGELVAPLFDDVAENLRGWRQQGLGLSVYSSGSVTAQQLLYQHSRAGDLRGLFQHWFDTRTGPKQSSSSYSTIASALKAEPREVLFVSDSAAECRAAQAAGMAVLFSDREGNPQRDPQEFTAITSFDEVSFSSSETWG